MQEHYANPQISPTEKLFLATLKYCDINTMNSSGAGAGMRDDYSLLKPDLTASSIRYISTDTNDNNSNRFQNNNENNHNGPVTFEIDGSEISHLLDDGGSYTTSKENTTEATAVEMDSSSSPIEPNNSSGQLQLLDMNTSDSICVTTMTDDNNTDDNNNVNIPRTMEMNFGGHLSKLLSDASFRPNNSLARNMNTMKTNNNETDEYNTHAGNVHLGNSHNKHSYTNGLNGLELSEVPYFQHPEFDNNRRVDNGLEKEWKDGNEILFGTEAIGAYAHQRNTGRTIGPEYNNRKYVAVKNYQNDPYGNFSNRNGTTKGNVNENINENDNSHQNHSKNHQTLIMDSKLDQYNGTLGLSNPEYTSPNDLETSGDIDYSSINATKDECSKTSMFNNQNECNADMVSHNAMMRQMLGMDFDFMNENVNMNDSGAFSGSTSNRGSNSSRSSDNMSLTNMSWSLPYSPDTSDVLTITDVIPPVPTSVAATATRTTTRSTRFKDTRAPGSVLNSVKTRPQSLSNLNCTKEHIGGLRHGHSNSLSNISSSFDSIIFAPSYMDPLGTYIGANNDSLNMLELDLSIDCKLEDDQGPLRQDLRQEQEQQPLVHSAALPQHMSQRNSQTAPAHIQTTKQSQKGATVKLEQPSYAKGGEDNGAFGMINLRRRRAWSRKGGSVSAAGSHDSHSHVHSQRAFCGGSSSAKLKKKKKGPSMAFSV